MADRRQILMRALEGIPEVQPGDDLGALVLEALPRSGLALEDGDILVVAHKVVSKAEGRMVNLATVEPGAEAVALARELKKDPRKVEVILGESDEVLRARRHPGRPEGVLICRHRLGFICANAGVDESNVPGADWVVLLPEDPDASARNLRDQLERATGRKPGVVVTDTFGRPWRRGLVNVALGLAGVPAVVDAAGTLDAQGRTLTATAPAVADELAAAAGLLMDKAGQTPVVLVRGVRWGETGDSGRDLLRGRAENLFP
jgi:coenzyme F420-0:L-glutamate ligase/coenzyme F420-1:gamma-L-glutamate ligase